MNLILNAKLAGGQLSVKLSDCSVSLWLSDVLYH